MRCILNEKPLWCVVLAGGDGTRLRRFTEQCLGCEGPKQYCAVIGTRSMLRHTLDRSLMLIPRERLLTIITRKHLPFAEKQLNNLYPENVLVQPLPRDTGIAILYSLLDFGKILSNSKTVHAELVEA
jgi:mannose-1-phosphate guanylyltransferase